MTEASWIGLTARERTLVLNALGALRRSNADKRKVIDALTIKLVTVSPFLASPSGCMAAKFNGL